MGPPSLRAASAALQAAPGDDALDLDAGVGTWVAAEAGCLSVLVNESSLAVNDASSEPGYLAARRSGMHGKTKEEQSRRRHISGLRRPASTGNDCLLDGGMIVLAFWIVVGFFLVGIGGWFVLALLTAPTVDELEQPRLLQIHWGTKEAYLGRFCRSLRKPFRA